MMFKHEMAAKARTGEKTETRRPISNKIIYKVGTVQPIQEDYIHKAKDHIKILKVWPEMLADITPESLMAEGGFKSLAEFIDYLNRNCSKKGELVTKSSVFMAYKFEYIPNEVKQ